MSNGSRRWAQPALVAGGVAWTAWSLVATATGVVERPLLVLVALSGALLAVGLAGLVWTLPWAYRFPGGEGAALAGIGAGLFALGQGLTVLGGEGGLATWLLAPGVLALVGGAVLLGVGVVRARRLPPWIGTAVLVGAVLFLGFDRLPGLAAPFGLAWVALGGHLWRRPDRPTAPREPSPPGG